MVRKACQMQDKQTVNNRTSSRFCLAHKGFIVRNGTHDWSHVHTLHSRNKKKKKKEEKKDLQIPIKIQIINPPSMHEQHPSIVNPVG